MSKSQQLTRTRGGDIRTIEIGPFRMTETGLEIIGRPDFEEYQSAGEFIKRTYKASSWWMADWLRYGESRKDWAKRLSQAIHFAGVSEKTLKNVRSVAAIKPAHRRANVEFALHAEVAGMPDDEQDEWLDRAETEGWTRNDLRLHIRSSKRRKVIEGQATLKGMFRAIMADPNWRYNDSGVIAGSAYARAESSYETATIEDICKLFEQLRAHTLPVSTLFMWVPVPLLFENPGPREVLEAGGFTYKSNRTWDKVTGMPSNYAQQITHEHLIIATRGGDQPDQPTPHEPSIFRERVRGEHSEKPNKYLRAWIEKHWTTGPYLELFGRERVEGWMVFGNDASLWHQDVERSA